MNKIYFLIFISIILFVACKLEKKSKVIIIEKKTKTPQQLYIVDALGTEPFWNINIQKNKAIFTFLEENIDSILYDNIYQLKVKNEDNFIFVLQNSNSKISDTLYLEFNTKNGCSDGMSDKIFGYNAKFRELIGCANVKIYME